VADAGDKAGKVRAARDNRRKAIEDRSAARLEEARKRIRASVRYEHELGKLRGQPFDVQDRAWNRWRKRKAGERVRGNDALKAAIARAKAVGPRKVDVHQDHLTGNIVSKRSKTGNPACSAAMSAWKLGRGTPAVHAMLAKCRAQASGRRQATLARAGGNEARAQHLEHRSKQGDTAKERADRAAALRVGRAAASPQGGGYARAELKKNPPIVAADRVEGLQRAIHAQKHDQQRHMTETGKIRPGHEKEAAQNLASIREQQDRLRRAADIAKKRKFPVREAAPSTYDAPRSRVEVLAAQARNRGDSAEAARLESKVSRAKRAAPAAPATEAAKPSVREQADAIRKNRREGMTAKDIRKEAKFYRDMPAEARRAVASARQYQRLPDNIRGYDNFDPPTNGIHEGRVRLRNKKLTQDQREAIGRAMLTSARKTRKRIQEYRTGSRPTP